jgi:lysophospholipase-3
MTDRLVSEGLVRGTSLRGAPYDFRYTPTDEWRTNMKALVEETYTLNKNTKVVLVTHSMGCIYTLNFLNTMTQEWKDTYIQLWVPFSGVWHGSTNIISLMATGNNEGIPFVSAASIKEEQRTYETNHWMVPSPKSWADGDTLAIIAGKKYFASQYQTFFTDIGYPEGWKYYNMFNNITDDLIAPGVPVYGMYSRQVDTPKYYEWSTSDVTKAPTVTNGDGDGTVPLQSLTAISKWQTENSKSCKYYCSAALGMNLIQLYSSLRYILSTTD